MFFFQFFMFKMIKKYFFFFISCFYLVKWPSYFTLCENGYFTKMCTTVHKINFFNFFFQNLKIYYIEMVQFIFEGSRTNFIFWSKFAYVLVRTGVPPLGVFLAHSIKCKSFPCIRHCLDPYLKLLLLYQYSHSIQHRPHYFWSNTIEMQTS